MVKSASAQKGRRPGPGQLARSRETRERVVGAATQLIAEGGVRSATALRIADRSGVSWGGIQHQFGSKEAILDAVLDHVLMEFNVAVERFSTRAESIEGRARALVRATWDLMRNPAYQAFRQVMQNTAPKTPAAASHEPLARVAETLQPMRAHWFPDLADVPAKSELINVVLFATLSGMAEQERYGVLTDKLVREQLRVLTRTLVAIVDDAPA